MTPLITVAELADALDGDRPPVVLDVRWTLGGPPGHGEYLAGHIPGAVYVDLDAELAEHGVPSDGRHPLPSVERLQQAARRWGVKRERPVVVYDGAGNLSAARAWWLLRWAGVTDVRLLDGALPAWIASGRPLATDDVVPRQSTIELSPGALPTIEPDDLAAFVGAGVLLDARAPERFRGETEPIDPKAGHIPGAQSAPTGDNLGPDGRFLPASVLRDRFAAYGIDDSTPVAAYCGSGVTACHQLAALAVAGFDATLYPGSWSQWSNTDRPVATGG